MAASGLTPISVTTSTFVMTKDHAGALIILNRAGGVAITLPVSTGSGLTYNIMVGTTLTGSSTIKVATSGATMMGPFFTNIITGATSASFGEAASGADNTITMSGTTTGGIKGSTIELTDIEAGVWLVSGNLIGSGVLASSLSNTAIP